MQLEDQSPLMCYSVTTDWGTDHILSWAWLASLPPVICPIGFCGAQGLGTKQMWSTSPAVQQLPPVEPAPDSTRDKSLPAPLGTDGKAHLQGVAQMAHLHNGIWEIPWQFCSSTRKRPLLEELCEEDVTWMLKLWVFTTTALKILL